jgi:hypothetical protein
VVLIAEGCFLVSFGVLKGYGSVYVSAQMVFVCVTIRIQLDVPETANMDNVKYKCNGGYQYCPIVFQEEAPRYARTQKKWEKVAE